MSRHHVTFRKGTVWGRGLAGTPWPTVVPSKASIHGKSPPAFSDKGHQVPSHHRPRASWWHLFGGSGHSDHSFPSTSPGPHLTSHLPASASEMLVLPGSALILLTATMLVRTSIFRFWLSAIAWMLVSPRSLTLMACLNESAAF